MREMIASIINAIPSEMLAGASGGLVKWMTLREDFKTGMTSLIAGSISAMYLSPLVIPIIEPIFGKIVVSPEKLSNLTGFIVGVCSMALVGLIIDLVTDKKKKLNISIDTEKESESQRGESK